MTIDVCPVCKKKDHRTLNELKKCYEKFYESLNLGA